MRISEFDFELPHELIAQQPLEDRTASRMLVVDRRLKGLSDHRFSYLPDLLANGDLLVLNNTKVFPARLLGQTETGAKLEIFLVREIGERLWETLARPARRLRPGKRVIFGNDLSGVVQSKSEDGRVIVRLDAKDELFDVLIRIGRTPLPPYIRREGSTVDTDRERYQTVFAKHRGSIAAPTAGLHFTPELLEQIVKKGIEVLEITLHVGYGTFEPVRVDDLSEHRVSPEMYEISAEAARKMNTARSEGRRLIAVGTTTTRALEAAANAKGTIQAGQGVANLTITPGYTFKVVDSLITNFHLPRSSLLVLTSTFGGHDLIMRAYRHAVEEGYRFYSYGDCMFIQ